MKDAQIKKEIAGMERRNGERERAGWEIGVEGGKAVGEDTR